MDELKEELDSRIRMFNGESTTPQMKKVAEGVSVAKIILNGWLESYTTEEPEGVEPIEEMRVSDKSFYCKNCHRIVGEGNSFKLRYCPDCGTKIKWEVE